MQKLAHRLSVQKYWDQTAFNEEIFFLSHGDVSYVPISVRVLDILRFQNSKARPALSLFFGSITRNIDYCNHQPCARSCGQKILKIAYCAGAGPWLSK